MSRRRNKRNIFKDKHLHRPTNTTTTETLGKEYKVYYGIPGKKLQLLVEYGRYANKGEGIQDKKFKMWGNLLDQQKLAFFNHIKSEETTKIYKKLLKKDEIFIPRKLKEKITPPDIEEQKKIKAKLNLMKLKSQTEIMEDKNTHYNTKYHEIDKELITEIR